MPALNKYIYIYRYKEEWITYNCFYRNKKI